MSLMLLRGPIMAGMDMLPYLIVPLIIMGSFILDNFIVTFHTLDTIQDQVKLARDTADTFDFIVVGAGSAGCVVASRLAENKSIKILVLEAGGEPNPLLHIPIFALSLLNRPMINWQYSTAPQDKACLSFHNASAAWMPSKLLGGSSTTNLMIHLRGHALDFDNWANLTGDRRWAYENVLEFFKKSESYTGEWGSEKYHGKDGPLHVTDSPYHGMADLFVKAGQEFGYHRTDPNGQHSQGFSHSITTQKNGLRESTYEAFFKPVMHQANVFVYKYSHVTQILFQGPELRAAGVSYFRHGQKRIAYATREVIISAGSLNTPQILMFSGIGARNQLEKFQIPVILDRPGVGQNLQDHVGSLIGPFLVNRPVSLKIDRDLFPNGVSEYVTSGGGPLSSSGILATASLTSSQAFSKGRENWPDLQFLLLGIGVDPVQAAEANRVLNLRSGILGSFYEEAFGQDSFQILSFLSRPQSRGEATLQSNDPLQPLLFNPNYLDKREDILTLIEGAKMVVELVEGSRAFTKMGGRLTRKPFPSCLDVPFRSDSYWDCYNRQFTLGGFDVCCTAGMGREGDRNSVVDSELKVIGTRGLRIIDASVMPQIVSTAANAATIMIAEMGAQFIKTDEGWLK